MITECAVAYDCFSLTVFKDFCKESISVVSSSNSVLKCCSQLIASFHPTLFSRQCLVFEDMSLICVPQVFKTKHVLVSASKNSPK